MNPNNKKLLVSGTDMIAIFEDDGDYQISNGVCVINDYETGEPKWLWIPYIFPINYDATKSKFYKLPFDAEPVVGINSAITSSSNIFYDMASATISVLTDVCNVEIYNVVGARVDKGYPSTVSTSGWNSGIYIVKATTLSGEVLIQKILVK